MARLATLLNPKDAAARFAAIVAADSEIGAFRAFAQPPDRIASGALSGLTVAIKDNIDVAGLPTRAGLGIDPPPAAVDAPVVMRLRAAGAIILGKTKLDEAALGATGNNAHDGAIRNPRAPRCSPGGSSGGSAAAVAAGFCPIALGTDTMGSVRIPASYCGIVGLMPTRGTLPMQGVVPLSPSLDQIGILAADVAMAALAFSAAAGSLAAAPAGRLRIGIPEALKRCAIAPEIERALARAGDALRRDGHMVVKADIADWEPAALRRAAFLVVEAEGAIVHRARVDAADDPALSSAVRRLFVYGRDCPPEKLASARRALAAATAGLDAALARFDVLLTPTTTHTAFAGAPPLDQADLTVLANLGGVPSISIPYGADDAAKPIGLQLIGRRHTEAPLLALAALLEGNA